MNHNDILHYSISSRLKMLVNKTVDSVRLTTYSGKSALLTEVLSGCTLLLPALWERLSVERAGRTSTREITPLDTGVLYLDDGRITLTCPTSQDDTYTLEDNRYLTLYVQNRTDVNYSFLNEAAECTIVPARSFMTVVGKTMVCSATVSPTRFFSTSSDKLLFSDLASSAVDKRYVSEGSTLLTFSARFSDLHSSNVVITTY